MSTDPRDELDCARKNSATENGGEWGGNHGRGRAALSLNYPAFGAFQKIAAFMGWLLGVNLLEAAVRSGV